MGEVDSSVRAKADEQQSAPGYGAPPTGNEYSSPPPGPAFGVPPTASMFEAREEPRVVEPEVIDVEKPVGFLALVKKIPWWGWAGITIGGFLIASLLEDDAKTHSKNRGPDEEPEGDDEEDPVDTEDDIEDDEDDEDDPDDADDDAPPPAKSRRKPKTRRRAKVASRSRVIEDDTPPSDPEPSVIDDVSENVEDSEEEESEVDE